MFSHLNLNLMFFLLSSLFFQNIEASVFKEKISFLETESLTTSPELNSLDAKMQKSKSGVYSGFSYQLPKANLNIKKQKNYFESTSPLLQSLGLTTPDYSWGIDYQWSLFNYGVILNTRRSLNQSSLDSIENNNGIKEYRIGFHTTILNYILAKYKQATIVNSIKKAETAKKEASLGFQLGQKTKIDVLRSEANFVSLSSKKTSYDDEEQSAKSKFIEKTGLNIESLNFLDNLTEAESIELIDELAQYKKIQENISIEASPLFEKINTEIKNSNLDAEKITQSEWPELKLQGSYENSADQISDTLHHPTRSHTIALVLTIPILSGGSLISSNFEQYFLKKQISYTRTKNLLELNNTFKNTSIKVHALETLVESLQINVNQFEELYRLTSKSYTLGKSTLFELLDVQDNLLESKINLATNKIQLYQLAENYNWQTGIQ